MSFVQYIREVDLMLTHRWYAVSGSPIGWMDVGNPDQCDYFGGQYCYTPLTDGDEDFPVPSSIHLYFQFDTHFLNSFMSHTLSRNSQKESTYAPWYIT